MNSFELAPKPTDPTKSAKLAIMTAEEYAEVDHDTPYMFELESGNKKLTYFGASHSVDVNDAMFIQLKKAFEQSRPDLVLVEGYQNLQVEAAEIKQKLISKDLVEIVNQRGEPGFTIKLAIDNGIEFDSPEPSYKDQIQYIEGQGISREAIFATEILQLVLQWHRHIDKSTERGLREYLQRFIDDFEKHTRWVDFDYSYGHLNEIAQQIWREEINETNPGYYEDKMDPIPWKREKDQQTVSNEVSRLSSRFRDEYIVGKIAEYLKNHDRIFIVYGASHAVMQEPALKKLMEQFE